MFTPLQEALKKLREVRETEQPQPKRQAVAAPPNPQSSVNAGSADMNGMDDMDFEFGDADVFDDLLVDDMTTGEDAPTATQLLGPTPAQPPRLPPATQQSASRLAAFTYNKPAQRTVASQHQPNNSSQVLNGSQRPNVSQVPSRSQVPASNSQIPSRLQAPPAPCLSRQASGEASQQDPFATPRPGSSSSRVSGQPSDFVTTIVSTTRRRISSLAQQRQEIPGPAGLVGKPIQCAIAPTQRPQSAFKTPMSRRALNEQSSDVDFEGGTWAAMLDHLGMPPYGPLTAKSVVRTEEKAAWPISRVLELTRSQKIPTMLVQLREIGSSESDAGAVVVDPTGEMSVSIHHAVMRRVAFPLAAGTSIILHNVAAVKMAGWPPFLVVTGGTIEQIFTVKSAGTREDPVVIEDTQRSSILTPTRPPQATNRSSARPTSPRTDGLRAGAAQPAVDLDDALDLLPDEALLNYSDDGGDIDLF
ncbi:hypothetical protein GGF38_000678 [Coemansia sp. RSA 25]|nr:hypothetical protein GGF38_000678 [Coemansia sp. RSA 25]